MTGIEEMVPFSGLSGSNHGLLSQTACIPNWSVPLRKYV